MTSWVRVSRRHPCPVCEHGDWCLISPDGSAVICPRTPQGAHRHLPDAGYLHRLQSDDWPRPHVRRVEPPASNRTPVGDFGELSARHERAADDVRVSRLAAQLRVSADSLRRLHIGWDGEAWTFPMRNVVMGIVGIRRRLPNGRKLSVRGSRSALFVPDGVPTTGQLFICEGPTDTAALLDLGCPAIGRPNCSGGTTFIVELARGRGVVIVADADAPGQRGAIRLAASLQSHGSTVQIITPPRGIDDARAWVQAGATRDDIEWTIANGPVVRFAEHTDRAERVSLP